MESRDRSIPRPRRAVRTAAFVCAIAIAAAVGAATGSSAATIAPSGPRSPSAAPLSGGALVHWFAPRSPGSAPITAYVVTPVRNGAAGAPRVFKSRATTQVVGGLTNGTAYAFRIAARSAAGTGAAVEAHRPDRRRRAHRGPARLGSCRATGRAAVSWSAPKATNGAPITAYAVTALTGHSIAKTQIFAGRATSRVVTGLRNGVAYRFRVRARNARGTGPASPPSNTIVPHATSAAKPPAAGYFATKPPGAKLPSAAACAAQVHQSTWEPRPDNFKANHTVPQQPVHLGEHVPLRRRRGSATTSRSSPATSRAPPTRSSSGPRASGDGPTTSCVRRPWSRATGTSRTVGDYESRSSGHCVYDMTGDPCPTSFGIIQVRWYYHPAGELVARARFELPGNPHEHRVQPRSRARRDARVLRRPQHVPRQHARRPLGLSRRVVLRLVAHEQRRRLRARACVPSSTRSRGSLGRTRASAVRVSGRRRCGRVVRGAADPAAELRALTAEHAPAALEAGNDPRVHHPDVDEQRLVAAARRALRASTSLRRRSRPPRPCRARRSRCAGASGRSVPRTPAAGRCGGTRGSSARRSSRRVLCRRTTAPTGARDRSRSRGGRSCSARRCTARTPSTGSSPPLRASFTVGKAAAAPRAAVICCCSSRRCASA